jgi:type IX secretion system PorP/SprF family membrane protein
MYMKLRIFSLLFAGLFFLSNVIIAQSDISMITHSFNRGSYNPAAIARPNYLYLFSSVRTQWNGVSGAPMVINIQASQFFESTNSAFGISLISDKIGVSQVINPMLTYAFKIENNRDWSLSMGLSAGVFSRNFNGTQFEPVEINDPSINYEVDRIIRPDANVGLEVQSPHFIFGASSTHLFSIMKPENLFLASNHRYAYAMYKQNNIELFNYNVGVQMVNRNNLTVVEGSANIRFKHATGLSSGPREIFDIGMTYRSSKQMTFLFGLNLFNDFRVGYAYNQSFNTGYTFNTTHEIMLEYRIFSRLSSGRAVGQKDEFWYH